MEFSKLVMIKIFLTFWDHLKCPLLHPSCWEKISPLTVSSQHSVPRMTLVTSCKSYLPLREVKHLTCLAVSALTAGELNECADASSPQVRFKPFLGLILNTGLSFLEMDSCSVTQTVAQWCNHSSLSLQLLGSSDHPESLGLQV